MMYPFLTLNDDTEIVHSEMFPSGEVRVYIERPDARDGFHSATCFFALLYVEGHRRLRAEEIVEYQKILESTAHLILRFAKGGGFENASGF